MRKNFTMLSNIAISSDNSNNGGADLKQLQRLHRRYQDIESSINKQLNRIIAQRKIDVRPIDICTAAKISRPTFYLHCGSCDDAMRKYEKVLKTEFTKMLASCTKIRSIFTLFLIFIKKHDGYFNACIVAKNFYLIHELAIEVIRLTEKRYADGLSQNMHVCAIYAILAHWHTQAFDSTTLQQHVRIIMETFGLVDGKL